MPQHKLKFETVDKVPAELKPFAVGDGTEVTIWYGDKVAEETNPALAVNRDAILEDKRKSDAKVLELTNSITPLASELNDLRLKVAQGTTLSPEDVALLNTVKPLGTAEEIKTAVEKYPTMSAELTTLKANELHSKVFKTMGYASQAEKIFQDLISNQSKMAGVSEVVFQNVQVGKETVERPFVKVKDATGVEATKSFEDYVKDNPEWKPYLPALTAKPANDNGNWFRTISPDNGDGTQKGGLLANVIKAQTEITAKIPNPLLPTNQQSSVIGEPVVNQS